MPQRRSAGRRLDRRRLGDRHAGHLRKPQHDQSIAASLARAAGMNQMVALPVIEKAELRAVLAWYL